MLVVTGLSVVTSDRLVADGNVSFGMVVLMVMPVGWFLGPLAGFASAVAAAPLSFQVGTLLGTDTGLYTNGGFGPGFVLLTFLGIASGWTQGRFERAQHGRARAGMASDILRLVAAGRPTRETLESLSLRTEKELGGARCSILLLDTANGTLHHAAAPSLPPEYSEAIDGLAIGPSAGSCGTAAYTGRRVVVEDIATDPKWDEFRELALTHGLRSCWSMPMRGRNAEILGTFAIYYDRPRSPRAWELSLVNEATHLAALTVDRQRDERQRRDLEEEVRRAQKLEGLDLLAGGIAHDFNNLLVAVMGNASLLESELRDESLQEYLDEIQLGAQRAAELADQMLTYAGRHQVAKQPVELNGLVEEFRGLLGSLVQPPVRLEFDLSEGLPSVEGSASQIGQVVVNLVKNAAEAIEPSAGTIRVSTHCDASDRAAGVVWLQVQDDGPGLDETTRDRIFDPFFSTKPTGRGLGLAISFGVIRAHGGAVEVDTAPGEGCTFRISLPISQRQDRAELPASLPPPAFVGEGIAVVVDDEEPVRRVAGAYLERLGFEVRTAGDPDEAIELVRASGSDLRFLLIDISMPGMDGRELLRHLEPLPAGTSVALTTGYDIRELGDPASHDDVPILHKPYDLDALRRFLAELRAA